MGFWQGPKTYARLFAFPNHAAFPFFHDALFWYPVPTLHRLLLYVFAELAIALCHIDALRGRLIRKGPTWEARGVHRQAAAW